MSPWTYEIKSVDEEQAHDDDSFLGPIDHVLRNLIEIASPRFLRDACKRTVVHALRILPHALRKSIAFFYYDR